MYMISSVTQACSSMKTYMMLVSHKHTKMKIPDGFS